MFRWIWRRITGQSASDRESETEGNEPKGIGDAASSETRESVSNEEDTGFVPSLLDASVLFSHGANTQQIEADHSEEAIEEEAAALDEYHDRN